MLTYDELVAALEDSWMVVGLHEHSLLESVLPDSHDRSYRAELFPDHPDPLTEETMPPWVEVSFSWLGSHQLRSEGREIKTEPIDLTWTYTVFVQETMQERSDHELVRLFQRAVHNALQQFYPADSTEMTPIAVEVRRVYQGGEERPKLAYVQLVSTNITDLSDLWPERNSMALSSLIQSEVQLAGAVIQALAETFNPSGRGGYHSVDTA